jgi:hypothetical protein
VRVRPQDVDAVVADLRANDFPDFRIWPGGSRDEYHTIVVLEPLDKRNRAAIGFDMFTHPARRAAMERARDSGEPSSAFMTAAHGCSATMFPVAPTSRVTRPRGASESPAGSGR